MLFRALCRMLNEYNVVLDAILLKPNMVLPGVNLSFGMTEFESTHVPLWGHHHTITDSMGRRTPTDTASAHVLCAGLAASSVPQPKPADLLTTLVVDDGQHCCRGIVNVC